MSTITIEIPEYLRKQVESLSSEEGFSIDHFFTMAASEKLSVIRELDYIAERASKANDEAFEKVLQSVPATTDIPDWDQVPPATSEEKKSDAGV